MLNFDQAQQALTELMNNINTIGIDDLENLIRQISVAGNDTLNSDVTVLYSTGLTMDQTKAQEAINQYNQLLDENQKIVGHSARTIYQTDIGQFLSSSEYQNALRQVVANTYMIENGIDNTSGLTDIDTVNINSRLNEYVNNASKDLMDDIYQAFIQDTKGTVVSIKLPSDTSESNTIKTMDAIHQNKNITTINGFLKEDFDLFIEKETEKGTGYLDALEKIGDTWSLEGNIMGTQYTVRNLVEYNADLLPKLLSYCGNNIKYEEIFASLNTIRDRVEGYLANDNQQGAAQTIADWLVAFMGDKVDTMSGSEMARMLTLLLPASYTFSWSIELGFNAFQLFAEQTVDKSLGKDLAYWYFGNGSIKDSALDNILAELARAEAATIRYSDPLVLDLNGDGLNPTSVDKGANFDLDQNGYAEKMQWIQGDDALLAIDRNGNGLIDDGSELFGDHTRLASGIRAKNGFQALAEFDTNGDGIIDVNDTDFSKLLVWRDINGNGISENGELTSLSDVGVVSISLSYKTVNKRTNTNVVIGNTATFTKSDGSTFQIGEYWTTPRFYDTVDNSEVGLVFPEDILSLPNTSPLGNTPSLHKAMLNDETGRIKELLTNFVKSRNRNERFGYLEEILMIITGAENVASNSRGSNFDAKKLTVIESAMGKRFSGVGGANPNTEAAPILDNVYRDLLQTYYGELLAQTSLRPLLPFMIINSESKTLDWGMLEIGLSYLKLDSNLLDDFGMYMQHLEKSNIISLIDFKKYFIVKSPEYVQAVDVAMGTAIVGTDDNDNLFGTFDKRNIYGNDGDDSIKGGNYDDVIYGGSGNDVINGGDGNDYLYGGLGDDILMGGIGNDYLYGGSGNDYLEGGQGNDTYVFNLGDGVDTIYDISGTKDILEFGEGINPEDIEFRRNEVGMILCIKGSDDKVILKDLYKYGGCYIEEVRFSDGTAWDVNYLLNAPCLYEGSDNADTIDANGSNNNTIYGNGGDDSISLNGRNNTVYGGSGDDVITCDGSNNVLYGGDGNDIIKSSGNSNVLIGGAGNDYLEGSLGNDTYVFNLGDGVDTIKDYGYSSYKDTLQFGEGINPEDIEFRRTDKDMIVCIKGSEDRIIVQNYFTYISASYDNIIEEIKFSDGTVWDRAYLGKVSYIYDGTSGNDTINAYTNTKSTIYGNDGDDSIKGGNYDDVIYGGSGNDVINGGDGNDYLYGGLGDGILMGGIGNDYLYGGSGNDYLEGGQGNDTYVFNLGDGVDTIYDISGTKDILEFGVNALDLIFSRSGNDLEISVAGTSDKIQVQSWYSSSSYQVEAIKTSDGKVLLNTQVEQLIQAMASFGTSSGMSWNEAIQNNQSSTNDVISQFWVNQATV